MASSFNRAIGFSDYALGMLNHYEKYFNNAGDEEGISSVEFARKNIADVKNHLAELPRSIGGKMLIYASELLGRLRLNKPLLYFDGLESAIAEIDANMQMVAIDYYFLENGGNKHI